MNQPQINGEGLPPGHPGPPPTALQTPQTQGAPVASTSTAATADPQQGQAPPPLPFDPTARQPAPTLGSQERQRLNGQAPQGHQAQQGEPEQTSRYGGWSSWSNPRKVVAIILALIFGALFLRFAFGGGGTNTTVNLPPADQAVPGATSTTSVTPQVPAAAVPFGGRIGGYPVRDSAVLVINGELESASVSLLDWLGRNPGVGICDVYVGAKAGVGYVYASTRTAESEVKLVDCNPVSQAPAQEQSTQAPTATVPPVQDSVLDTTVPEASPAPPAQGE